MKIIPTAEIAYMGVDLVGERLELTLNRVPTKNGKALVVSLDAKIIPSLINALTELHTHDDRNN